jgi:hypothetical protein
MVDWSTPSAPAIRRVDQPRSSRRRRAISARSAGPTWRRAQLSASRSSIASSSATSTMCRSGATVIPLLARRATTSTASRPSMTRPCWSTSTRRGTPRRARASAASTCSAVWGGR